MQRELDQLQVFKENVLFVWEKGETTYLRFWDKQLHLLQQNKVLEHDDPIVAVDFCEQTNLQVTVDTEGLIKVWNEYRELIREIKFNRDTGNQVLPVT